MTPRLFGNIFATLFIENYPIDVEELFYTYHQKFIDDYTHNHVLYYGELFEGDYIWALRLNLMHQVFKEISLRYSTTERYRLPKISA